MKTIFLVSDSLNRNYLPCYGNGWVQAPNIDRLARRGVVFDNHYCGSMPCMPARREMMTGRVNFLEAAWNGVEVFDRTLPKELQRQRKTYTHLITDHYHYWEACGANYHALFNTWEFLRGQEGDLWHPQIRDPQPPPHRGRNTRQDWVNRQFMDLQRDEDYPTPQCFQRAMDFLRRNGREDNWHLHLEVFDPHEPFLCPRRYSDLYNDTWSRPWQFDWPHYKPVADDEGPEAVEHIRKLYAGTLTMMDHWLGRLLDVMDEMNLWEDTTLVFTTDHGHMLGEHGYWAKNHQFDYQQLVNIPLIVCSPRASGAGRRVGALTGTIDVMPTILDLFGACQPPHVHGRSLRPLLNADQPHHDGLLFGYFGKDISMTDGRHTYCRQPRPGGPLFEYTSIPYRYSDLVYPPSLEMLARAEVDRGTLVQAGKVPLYKVPRQSQTHRDAPAFDLVYDIQADPDQTTPIHDAALEAGLAAKMMDLLGRFDAPPEQFRRVGLG
jgi:arylsulfatase A-like enzyme